MAFGINLTNSEFESMWEKGFRPYEIYVCNRKHEMYFGELKSPGEIKGWEIEHVFSTRELLKSYPYFDAVIGISDMSVCDKVWKG